MYLHVACILWFDFRRKHLSIDIRLSHWTMISRRLKFYCTFKQHDVKSSPVQIGQKEEIYLQKIEIS